jgi:hypothetical protein
MSIDFCYVVMGSQIYFVLHKRFMCVVKSTTWPEKDIASGIALLVVFVNCSNKFVLIGSILLYFIYFIISFRGYICKL